MDNYFSVRIYFTQFTSPSLTDKNYQNYWIKYAMIEVQTSTPSTSVCELILNKL
jgi:hypothetical protein